DSALILSNGTSNLTTVANGADVVNNAVVKYTAVPEGIVSIENGVVTVTGEVADKVVVTITGEYAGLTDDATLTIVKAPKSIEVDYEDGLTLEDAPLPEGWVWADPTTPLLEGSENAYKATYTENGETVEADVTVKVNEATPEKQPSFALDAVYVLDTNKESETYGDRFVDVTLSVKDNTGIASFTMNMGYNKDVVTPVSVQKDLYTGGITLSEDMNANPLTIVGASTTDITADGALFTVRFAVADDVLVETVLDGFIVSYDAEAGAICNAALETVEVTPNPVNANAITIPKATIDMTPDTISLKKGDTKDVKVEVTYYASTDYENAETAVVDVTDSEDLDLTMEDTKIATISDDTVTAKKAGTTELTAEYFGVLSDTTTVKVTKTPGGGGGSYKPVDPVLNKEQHGRYILGYPDSTMQPNRNITREEVAVIFYRLLTESAKQSYYSTDVSMLSDVAADSWSAVQIGTLVKLGIIVGYEDGTFRPHDPITRAEFAAIACRFDNLTNAPDSGFADVQGHWAKTYIDNAYAFGWIVGYEDGTFRPQNNITRAEAVTIINRVLGRDTDEAGVLDAKDIDTLAQLKQWTDLDESHWAFYQFLEATYSHEYVRRDGGSKGIENWTNLNEALNMD
ncbi:MAG: S-layer homology domain-containing protein, partial [Clostridia bacterium]|nr:S-layer homology domain-containing protein [Clostridia bacterium]